jgi:hypothetical protein
MAASKLVISPVEGATNPPDVDGKIVPHKQA